MTTAAPLALSGHVEFGTPAWFDETATYLRRRLAEADLGGWNGRFALSEMYTDPPPHLGRHGAVAFRIVIDGRDAQVVEGFDPDADMTATLDYTKGLELMCAVYAGDSAARDRMRREFRHRYGPDVARTTVRGPMPGEVSAVLDDLHDHMARRTVSGPDIGHRIDRLGLAARRDELDERGWTVLADAFSAAMADEIRDAMLDEAGTASVDRLSPRRLSGDRVSGDRLFQDAALHPWVLALAEHVLGSGCVLLSSAAPESGLTVSATWALDGLDGLDKGSIAIGRGGGRPPYEQQSTGDRVTLHNLYGRRTLAGDPQQQISV